MKKIKILFALCFIVSIALLYVPKQETIGELMLENIEALSEVGEGTSSVWYCWSSEKKGSGYWRCGSPCVFVNKKGPQGPMSTCHQ